MNADINMPTEYLIYLALTTVFISIISLKDSVIKETYLVLISFVILILSMHEHKIIVELDFTTLLFLWLLIFVLLSLFLFRSKARTALPHAGSLERRLGVSIMRIDFLRFGFLPSASLSFSIALIFFALLGFVVLG